MTRKVDYVYIEMILNKDSKYDVIPGLFKGVVERKGHKFVLLQGLKNATNVVSVKFYGIMSLEVCEGDYTNFTYFTAEKVEQDAAYEMLEKLGKELLADGFGYSNDPNIIDTDKYNNVPSTYKDGKPLTSGTATSGTASGVGNFAPPHTRYSNNGTTYVRQSAVKPDPPPAVIGRTKTKKPTKAMLDEMLAKVQQITAGEFQVVLPDILGADESGVTEAEDDYGNEYYGHLC